MKDHHNDYEKQMKKRYDQRTRSRHFKIGDIVYLSTPPRLNPQSTDTKKLCNTRDGPFQIVDMKSKHAARLRNLRTGKYVKYSINVDKLKMGFLRQNLTFKPYQIQELEDITEQELKQLKLIYDSNENK